MNGTLDVRRSRHQLALHLVQFLELNFTRDFVFHFVDVALRTPEERSGRTCYVWEALRPQYDQRNHADHCHLGKT